MQVLNPATNEIENLNLRCSSHAAAAADFLEHIAKQLRHGTAPEDIGKQVRWIGTMMERRI